MAMLLSDWEASRIHFRARHLSDRVGSAGEDCVKGAHRSSAKWRSWSHRIGDVMFAFLWVSVHTTVFIAEANDRDGDQGSSAVELDHSSVL